MPLSLWHSMLHFDGRLSIMPTASMSVCRIFVELILFLFASFTIFIFTASSPLIFISQKCVLAVGCWIIQLFSEAFLMYTFCGFFGVLNRHHHYQQTLSSPRHHCVMVWHFLVFFINGDHTIFIFIFCVGLVLTKKHIFEMRIKERKRFIYLLMSWRCHI